MNLKEYAIENNMTLAEAREATGLTHWKQEVLDGPNVPVIVEESVVEDVVEDSKAVLSEARALRTGVGDKTKAYLEFVNDNKKEIPAEFARVEKLIERYL